MAKGKWQISDGWGVLLKVLPLTFAICDLPFAICHAVDTTPPRLFFSDAKISFTFPEHWTLEPAFPAGPLFSRTTPEGAPAYISCEISVPLDLNHLASDVPLDVLRQFAHDDVLSREPEAQILAEVPRTLAAQNAYEVTWKDSGGDLTLEYQSDYFFVEDRIYALTLRVRSDGFAGTVPDFQDWLGSLRVLTRRDSGSLDSPAHGGLWIHQTGGIKILIPGEWLIGVSDDHTLGATVVDGDMHSEITATVDVSSRTTQEISPDDQQEARTALEKKGFRVLQATDDPFHGYPAYEISYDGTKNDRYVRGQDIYVASPHGRWLFNMEADGRLFNKLTDNYRSILNDIQFL
jgi:hypothetical protein